MEPKRRQEVDTTAVKEETSKQGSPSPISARDTALQMFLDTDSTILISDHERKDIDFLNDLLHSIRLKRIQWISLLGKGISSLDEKESYISKLTAEYTLQRQQGSENTGKSITKLRNSSISS